MSVAIRSFLLGGWLKTCHQIALWINDRVPTSNSNRQNEIRQRKEAREALRRQKELQKQQREQEKLSELERARLEVEFFENAIEVLLSVHKECSPNYNWTQIASSPKPAPPFRLSSREFRARQVAAISPASRQEEALNDILLAVSADEQEHAEALIRHEVALAEHARMVALADRIVCGDLDAYTEAIRQLDPFSELFQMGSLIEFTIHSRSMVECHLTVNGINVIPSENKQLSGGGKLVARRTPRARFHQLYQDHVCGCLLRVTREMFALLPIELVLGHASVVCEEPSGGNGSSMVVLSTAVHRANAQLWDYSSLDPSDTIEKCFHRGDFKASRKEDAFRSILPITPDEIMRDQTSRPTILNLTAQVSRLGSELSDLFHRCSASTEFKSEVLR